MYMGAYLRVPYLGNRNRSLSVVLNGGAHHFGNSHVCQDGSVVAWGDSDCGGDSRPAQQELHLKS